MNIITTITTALASLNIPMAVGLYETDGKPYPDAYIVITPLYEANEDEADNEELTETTAADVNLYMRGDYQSTKDQIKTLLKSVGFSITYRSWVGYEKETQHHHHVTTIEFKEVL